MRKRVFVWLLAIAMAAPISKSRGEEAPSIMGSATTQTIHVPQWQPYDFVFTSAARPQNPFTLRFAATVKGPGNVTFKTDGFYDGDGNWKVRVAPNAEGAWSLVTRSQAPDLDGKTVRFDCVRNPNPHVHGGLRVDKQHPHHFVFKDGTRCFLMGYECDWLWALDLGKPTLDELNGFLDKLDSCGFNHVLMNAYAHDTKWREGKTGPDDFGPPPLFAWEGDNDRPDHSRFNLAYWRHYDRVMEALRQRGIVAHIMIKVYNKKVNWPAIGSLEDDLYFGWVVARYAAFPNVVWDFSKEAQREKNKDYIAERLRFIHERDPYQRLRTVHDDNRTYDSGAYDELVDFRSDQQHKDWRETILKQRAEHSWPVANVEFGYEWGAGGENDVTYRVAQDPKEVCRRAWEICMAGGYGAHYYTYTAWDVIRPKDTPPGYAYFKYLRQFFDACEYWLLEPDEGLVSEGYCLANPSKEYLVFLNDAKPFSLKLEGVGAPLKAQWYRPLTGQWKDGRELGNGAANLKPPEEWGGGPVALRVGAPRRPETPQAVPSGKPGE